MKMDNSKKNGQLEKVTKLIKKKKRAGMEKMG